MKNKEIEYLLKYLKNKPYISGKFYTEEKIKVLSKKELDLLLSYIEQLENNRDKALKIIDSYELGKYDYSIPAGGIIELREVLKGGSDV